MSEDVARSALIRDGLSAADRRVALCRAFDVGLALLALVVLAPLMVVVAVAVALDCRGWVIFADPRLGLGGRTFRVLKFTTMCVDADAAPARHLEEDEGARSEWERDFKLRRDPSISPLGAFLRRSSLDELPQLINVLVGEMSIVGPRPIVEAERARYGEMFAAYCSVRPGLTGVWRIGGRNGVSYARRVEMDARYTREKSLWLDARVVLATVPALLLHRGAD